MVFNLNGLVKLKIRPILDSCVHIYIHINVFIRNCCYFSCPQFGNKIWIVFEIELDYKHKVFYAKLKITYGTNFTFSILT